MRYKFLNFFFVIVTINMTNCNVTSDRSKLLILISDHKSEYSILTSKYPDPVERFAAEELQKYIELITGVRLPFTNDNKKTPFLAIGNYFSTKENHSEQWGKWEDKISVKYIESNILIGGPHPRGTLFSVYKFLETVGCRWYSPRTDAMADYAERIPKLETLSVTPVNFEITPLMKYRKRDADSGGRTFTPETWPVIIDWAAKQKTNIIAVGLNGFEKNKEIIINEVKKRGIKLMVGQHDVMFNFLPPEKYFVNHSEWYGFLDGQRRYTGRGRKVVFETADSSAVKTFSDNLINYLIQNPEIDIFQLWPPDVAFWSESPEALAIGPPAERMAIFVRRIMKDLKDAGIKTRVSYLAYSYYTDPPSDMSFSNDVIIEFCPINQDFKYVLSDSTSSVNFEYYKKLKKWINDFPGEILHYSYYAKYSWRSLPVVLPYQIAAEIRDWSNIGENGAGMYFEPGNWLTLEINHLAFSQACVDQFFNVNVWYDNYLIERYGNASSSMKEYFRITTKISLEALIPQSSRDDISGYFALINEAEINLENAMKQADNNESRWLISKQTWQPEYILLALNLRKAQIENDFISENKYREQISDIILRHFGEPTTLERGYGYRAQ